MSDPTLALHKAVLARLGTLSVPAYDAVPQGTAYPYVTINNVLSNNADFLSARKQERFIFLSVWSENRGQEQILGIFQEIDAAFHNQPLAMDTGNTVSIVVDTMQTTRDADNVTYQGTVILRAITEH